jgi:iron(III) transport system ATP-binding protein
MDEPLSNLDAKLRVEMRTAIRSIQRDVGITTVYVTHDQEEAMSISDRIAVMSEGVIHQCSKPKNVYMRPADIFVATFIGKTNILDGKLKLNGTVPELEFKNGFKISVKSVDPNLMVEDVKISTRPEEFTVVKTEKGHGIKATIKDSIFLGLQTHYFVELDTGEYAEIVEVSDIEKIIPSNTEVWLDVDIKKINLFNAKTGKSIMKNVDWMPNGE